MMKTNTVSLALVALVACNLVVGSAALTPSPVIVQQVKKLAAQERAFGVGAPATTTVFTGEVETETDPELVDIFPREQWEPEAEDDENEVPEEGRRLRGAARSISLPLPAVDRIAGPEPAEVAAKAGAPFGVAQKQHYSAAQTKAASIRRLAVLSKATGWRR